MEYTKNLRLSKPSYDDDVDIQVLNNNMDMLDEKVGNLPYLPLAGGTMQGNIVLPNRIGFKYGTKSELNFGKRDNKELVNVASDIFEFTCKENNEVFKIASGDVYYKNDKLIRDTYTSIGDFVGYIKLSTGVTIQWGFVNPSTTDGNIQHVTLQTPMATPNYAVFISRSNYTRNIKPDQDVPSNNATFNLTRTGFDILCARSTRGQAMFWFVIGGQL